MLDQFVVHPDRHLPCAARWLRPHPSINFQDNARYVADAVRGHHGRL